MDRAAPGESLKLTAYLNERLRGGGGRFLADELLDLFGRRRVATSIVLRGVGGFGPQRILRSDRSLSLSEDPPVAVTAVDTRAAIEELLGPLQAMPVRAQLTLERARLLTAADAVATLPAELAEPTKLTVYLGRKQRVDAAPAHIAVCELMHRRGLAGASVFLGVDGTRGGRRARAHFLGNNSDVPIMIVAVGPGPQIAAVLPEIAALAPEPVITVERVRICKRDGELFDHPHPLPDTDERGRPLWQKLTVYTSAAGCFGGEPIHRALLSRLYRQRCARGATVLRGIWGFHGDHRPHGDRWWAIARRVPVTTVIVDTPARIAAAFAVVDEVTAEQGLVTSETVPVLLPGGTDPWG
ncbi:DUF190 domain-containing protein [Mycobacterium sp. 1274756.6]|uniref:DUF190 domain-containing protein n=1 Tax=Mycobacterium sp. 1274756.6 TaxID=1834076 RepID=UPI0007FE520F|nr:DUF190 domain-containing protein [Mycobacterium sp. 1274756.6]OBJ70453.1 hypothetical protein A5643_10655 [Mycobacterium sp. 1274756.6]